MATGPGKEGVGQALTAHERLGKHFERLPRYDGNLNPNSEQRIARLRDGARVLLDTDPNSDSPDESIGVSVMSTAELLGNFPSYVRFVISKSAKGLNHIEIPKQEIWVGDIRLRATDTTGPKTIPFHDSEVADSLVGWLDTMFGSDRYSAPPISISFPQTVMPDA